MSVIFIDYAFLLVVFLMAAYNALKAPDDTNRSDKEERI